MTLNFDLQEYLIKKDISLYTFHNKYNVSEETVQLYALLFNLYLYYKIYYIYVKSDTGSDDFYSC